MKAPSSKKNWARVGKAWLAISEYGLPAKGTIVLCDESQTIMWFAEKPSDEDVLHSEHRRDEDGRLLFDDDGNPMIGERTIRPVYWSPAVVVE